MWRNFGKTPTREAYASSWTKVVEGDLPADFDFPTDPAHKIAPFVIGPHGDSMNSDTTVDIDELQHAFEHGLSVHYWAWIEYGDISSQDTYRTEYHVVLTFRRPPREGTDLVFSLSPRFNGVDGECFRAPGTESTLRRATHS